MSHEVVCTGSSGKKSIRAASATKPQARPNINYSKVPLRLEYHTPRIRSIQMLIESLGPLPQPYCHFLYGQDKVLV